MYGGVGGAEPRGSPLSRFKARLNRRKPLSKDGDFDFKPGGLGLGVLARLRGSEVGRGLLAAAPVGFDVIGHLLPFNEAAHARALDGADVREHVPPALVRLNE